MNDQEFLAAFDAGKLDPGAFPHAAHVRAAWLCLSDGSFVEGVARLRRGLKQLTIRAGQPGRYHETITVAYARLIHQRMRQLGPHTWPEFERRAPEFLSGGRELLAQFYDAATLASDEARQQFVPPASWSRSVVDRFLEEFAAHQADADAPLVVAGLPGTALPEPAGVEPVSAVAVLAVTSVGRSADWYARVFGFEVTVYPADPPHTLAWLSRGGAEVMVREAGAPVTAPEGWALCVRLSGGGIAAMHAALGTSGALVTPLREMPYRDTEFEVRDPDGYVVLVSESIDASPAL